MVRWAAIDIGSNSVRLLIAEVGEGGITPLENDLITSRLAEGVEKTGLLKEGARLRTLAAVEEFLERCRGAGVDKIRIGATSAVREADNQKEFQQSLRAVAGLEPEIFTGEEEARLSFWGVVETLPPAAAGPTLVIDIGGGSTELIKGVGREIKATISLPLGAVRLGETYPPPGNEPVSSSQLQQLQEQVKMVLAGLVKEDFQGGLSEETLLGVGLGGTVTTLAAIYLGLERYSAPLIHGMVLPARHIKKILIQLAGMDLAKRKEVVGLPPERADIIITGTVILLSLLEKFNLPEIISCEGDILTGMLLDLGREIRWGRRLT